MRKKNGGLLKLITVLVLGTLSFLLHTWLRTSIVTQSFEMGQLRKEVIHLENDLVSLYSRRQTKMNSENLYKLRDFWEAEGNHFRAARPNQIIFLNEPMPKKDSL